MIDNQSPKYRPLNLSLHADLMLAETQESPSWYFESALLLLFSVCRFCSATTVDVTTTVKGTFIKVTQFCMLCHYKFVWESQPFYGSFPAGNILLSASILFTGLMPTKVLRMLKYFGCATIGRKTFFRHQRDILQPAIHVQWRKQQVFVSSRSITKQGACACRRWQSRQSWPFCQIWILYSHRCGTE